MFKLLLQNFIKANGRSPNAIEMLQLKFKAASQANRGQILPFKQKRDFAAEIKAMMDDGTIKVGQVDKKNDNVLQRELFKNSNLNNPEPVTIKSGVSNSQLNKNKAIDQGIKVEPVNEKFIQFTIQDIKKKEPIEGMKIANQIIKREGDFVDLTEEQSKKILTEVNDHIMGVDLPIGPEDLAKGGRAGFYTGGITDIEPDLSDIGHGSDSLMARTRLVSPDGQATTSTGLNYLLAEDNDNMRIPFAGGESARYENYYIDPKTGELKKKPKLKQKAEPFYPKDFNIKDYYDPKPFYPKDSPLSEVKFAEGGRIGLAAGGGRRAFLKMLGLTGAGIAGLKSGIIGVGEGGAKKAVTETVKQAAGSGGQVPPYFLNLVKKIKTLGDDTLATKDKAIAKKYKDYTMEEDFAGNIEIIKKGDDVAEDVFMSYKIDDVPVKGKKGSAKVEEYEEFTARPDAEGKMKDVEPGVPDEVVQEGTMFEDNLSDFGKAEGGRIGYGIGGLSKLGITGSSRRFLEKIFGKGNLDEMIKRDPEMHRGLLEVTEMFRNRDKEGLKSYMKNFLPHMDDTEIEEFIIGDAVDAVGQAKFGLGDMPGQLIRLGSGRDYKAKIEAIKKLEDAQKLDTLDVTEEMIRKPNAFGGIQTMLGE